MNRDPDLFSIGEFSQITGLSVKTLRFYDEKGLLLPASVDSITGYRYYNALSVERARIITRLRELQFPLEEIQRVLAECEDDTQLSAHFQQRLRAIQERIRTDRKTAKALEKVLRDEAAAASLAQAGRFRVEEKNLASIIVAGLRMTGRYEECGRGFKTLAGKMGRHIAGKPLCLYFDDEFREGDASFEPCFPVRREVASVDGITVRTLPAARCLTLIHQGPYPQLGRSYKTILGEFHRRGLTADLPSRETYHKGPGMIFKGNPKNYLTEIQIPIKVE
jgi:DNA-binding transcriptional MerR regulator/effector-binding domain-containing protein